MRTLLLALIIVTAIGCRSTTRRQIPVVPENELGNESFANGDYEGAIARYDSWLEKYPQDADVYFMRGRALYQLERYEDAVNDFNLSVQYYPKNIAPLAYSCGALIAMGRDNEAREKLKEVYNHPMYGSMGEYEQFLVFLFDGTLKNRAGDYANAMAALDKAVETYNLNQVLFERQGSPYIKRHALQQRARCRFKSGDFAVNGNLFVADMEDYVSLAEQAGEIEADDYKSLAMAYYLSGQHEKIKQVLVHLSEEDRQALGKIVDDIPLFTQN